MFKKVMLSCVLINLMSAPAANADQDGYLLHCIGFDRWRNEEIYFSQMLDGYNRPVGRFYARNGSVALLQGDYTPRVFKINFDDQSTLGEVELRVFHPSGEEAFVVIVDSKRTGRNKMSAKTNFGQWKYSSKGADVSCTLSSG